MYTATFLNGRVRINEMVSYELRDGRVGYFYGIFPIFCHSEDDSRAFKLISSQVIDNGLCRNIEIQKAFKLPKQAVCRNLRRFRNEGAKVFFTPRNRKPRKATVMTPKILIASQKLLNRGLVPSMVANQVGVKKDTLHKAIKSGKLQQP